ncbi:MAG TPA: hypothetical protein VIM64_04855, partial [Puia sp.]
HQLKTFSLRLFAKTNSITTWWGFLFSNDGPSNSGAYGPLFPGNSPWFILLSFRGQRNYLQLFMSPELTASLVKPIQNFFNQN